MTRRDAQVDANQRELVGKLRCIPGVSVTVLSAVGGGVPDLLIGYRGVNVLLELKDGSKPPSAQKLTPAQQTWHLEWTGQVDVVRDLKEALLAIGIVKAFEPLEASAR